jgi:hypothetical protein
LELLATEHGESGSAASGNALGQAIRRWVISENEDVTHREVISCSQDQPLKLPPRANNCQGFYETDSALR